MGGGGPAEAGDHGGQIVAAIEAVLELGEIARDVFVADGMEGAGQTGLEVAEQGVGPLEGGGPDRLPAGARDDRPMAAAGIGDATEGVEAVAVDRPGGTQMAHRPALDRDPAEVGDPAELDPHRLALGDGFHGRDKGRLAGTASATFATRAFAPDVGVIDLDALAGQRLVLITFQHDLHQLVLDLPGGVMRHPETAGQLKAGQAVLALGQGVDRGKPRGQRQLGGMKDRAGDQRHLMAARRALLDRAGPEHDRVGSSAFRADETPRPAPREQRCPTLFLGAILQPKRRFAQTLLELHNVLGHPNLPQSLSSSSLYHPPRKLKFVGNQELVYLPPYSPDLNPIEQAFAKLKTLLRKTGCSERQASLRATDSGTPSPTSCATT